MHIQTEEYYHLYNRSNNNETVFRSADNYRFFLRKYRRMIGPHVETIAYCLMPTHFHFLIRISTDDIDHLRDSIGRLLASYTRAINKRHHRHGSLFQNHTKAKQVADDEYFRRLINYIHQNPLGLELASAPEDWLYSSYLDYRGLREGDAPLAIVRSPLWRASELE